MFFGIVLLFSFFCCSLLLSVSHFDPFLILLFVNHPAQKPEIWTGWTACCRSLMRIALVFRWCSTGVTLVFHCGVPLALSPAVKHEPLLLIRLADPHMAADWVILDTNAGAIGLLSAIFRLVCLYLPLFVTSDNCKSHRGGNKLSQVPIELQWMDVIHGS